MHEVLSDSRAMLYWSTPPHQNLDETRAWLDSMISDPPGERDDFIVEHDGRAIGKTGCWRLPEIGFILHPDYWGRGWPGAPQPSSEAVRALPHFCDHRRRRSPQSRLPGAVEGTGLRGDRSGGADLADWRDLVRQHLSRAAAPRTRLTSAGKRGSLRQPLGRR
jgi:hypothetical protein